MVGSGDWEAHGVWSPVWEFVFFELNPFQLAKLATVHPETNRGPANTMLAAGLHEVPLPRLTNASLSSPARSWFIRFSHFGCNLGGRHVGATYFVPETPWWKAEHGAAGVAAGRGGGGQRRRLRGAADMRELDAVPADHRRCGV